MKKILYRVYATMKMYTNRLVENMLSMLSEYLIIERKEIFLWIYLRRLKRLENSLVLV